MLKYIFKFILVLFSFVSLAQETDSIEYNKKNPERLIFIRPSIDLSRFALDFINDEKIRAFEISIDTEVKYKFFPIYEFGWNEITDNTENNNYSLTGTYHRIGINYNMLKYKHRLDRNLFFIGFRYALSSYTHQADNISQSNDWGTTLTNFPPEKETTHWGEFVIGLQGEIYKNIYMGWTIRLKQKFTDYSFDSGIVPFEIPGFGRGNKNTSFGLSYTLSYAIPIRKPVIIYPIK